MRSNTLESADRTLIGRQFARYFPENLDNFYECMEVKGPVVVNLQLGVEILLS